MSEKLNKQEFLKHFKKTQDYTSTFHSMKSDKKMPVSTRKEPLVTVFKKKKKK